MTRPRIGITTTARDPSDGKVRMTGDYFDAVRRAGGLALLLPPGEMSTAEILEACDGFVFSGTYAFRRSALDSAPTRDRL